MQLRGLSIVSRHGADVDTFNTTAAYRESSSDAPKGAGVSVPKMCGVSPPEHESGGRGPRSWVDPQVRSQPSAPAPATGNR
jgi:hypothetical protein